MVSKQDNADDDHEIQEDQNSMAKEQNFNQTSISCPVADVSNQKHSWHMNIVDGRNAEHYEGIMKQRHSECPWIPVLEEKAHNLTRMDTKEDDHITSKATMYDEAKAISKYKRSLWKITKLQRKNKSLSNMMKRLRIQKKQKMTTIKGRIKQMYNISESIIKEERTGIPFYIEMVHAQLKNAMKSRSQGIRWTKDIISFGLSLQYAGGDQLIDLLRGYPFLSERSNNQDIHDGDLTTEDSTKQTSNEEGRRNQCERIPVNVLGTKTKVHHCSGKLNHQAINMFFPSNSTLRGYLPPTTGYEGFTENCLSALKKAVERNPKFPKNGGIIADEMEIRHGLVFLRYCGLLVGHVDGPIAEKNVQQYVGVPMQEKQAKRVLQLFYISFDGTVTWPLAFFPSTGASGQFVFNKFDEIIQGLTSIGFNICWGSTDGFSGCQEFQRLMAVKYPQYHHIFDPLHILKLLRNTLLNGLVTSGKCPGGFNMKDIHSLWESDMILQNMLSYEDIFPSDKMNVKHVTKLLNAADYIPQTSAKGKGLHEYLINCKKLHACFMTNSMSKHSLSYAQVTEDINGCLNYFTGMQHNFTNQLMHHITTTLSNILQLRDLFKQMHGKELIYLSHLSTNVVEIFFSIQRSKIHFPNLVQYSQLYHRAWMEFIKKNASDLKFTFPITNTSQYYNNTSGVITSVADIHLSSPEKKRMLFQNMRKHNRNTDLAEQAKDHVLCMDLASEYQCSKKKLTIRESTCKVPSFKEKTNHWFCPEMQCSHKPYKNEKSFFTHLILKHKWTEEKIQLTPTKLFQQPKSISISSNVFDNEEEVILDSDQSSLVPHEAANHYSPSALPFLSLLSLDQSMRLFAGNANISPAPSCSQILPQPQAPLITLPSPTLNDDKFPK